MKQKLLNLPHGTWYSLVDRQDKEQILTTIKQLQEERHEFEFSEEGDKFMLVRAHVPEKQINCFFDLKEEQGYSVVKVGRSENLMYNGKLLAIR